MVGDNRKQVLDQGQNYITRALKLPIQAIEDAISVRQQEGQFTGTLIYSYLAEQVAAENTSGDLESMDLDGFEKLKMREDDF